MNMTRSNRMSATGPNGEHSQKSFHTQTDPTIVVIERALTQQGLHFPRRWPSRYKTNSVTVLYCFFLIMYHKYRYIGKCREKVPKTTTDHTLVR